MKVIFPHDIKAITVDELISNIQKAKSLNFYSNLVVEFCDSLSKKLMNDSECKKFPEVLALAFWLRKSNILELKRHYIQQQSYAVLLPKGTIFHVAPSNVDTIFLYSWVISVLCGNKNIVRISSRMSSVTQMIIAKFEDVINSKVDFLPIKDVTYFISFSHTDSALQKISLISDVRVIWGGDGTILNIRASVIPSRSIDIGFADRFSHCFFKAQAILDISNQELSDLSNQFYNDAFLFNQKACSSPRVCFWFGEPEDIEKSQNRFWKELLLTIQKRQNVIDPSISMFKLKNAYDWSLKTDGQVKYWGPELTNLTVNVIEKFNEIRELQFGAGSFVSIGLAKLSDSLDIFTSRDQTISYFGFEKSEMGDFILQINGNKIDRIVPIGQALSFGVVWDGYNLFEILSRKVALL